MYGIAPSKLHVINLRYFNTYSIEYKTMKHLMPKISIAAQSQCADLRKPLPIV